MLDTLGLDIGPNAFADWSGHDSLHVKLPELTEVGGKESPAWSIQRKTHPELTSRIAVNGGK